MIPQKKAKKEVRRLGFYGKGGIGKSTVSSNMSLLFHKEGREVLQIGCDPKADSSQLHVEITQIRPIVATGGGGNGGQANIAPDAYQEYVIKGRTGVHLLEAGAVEPGKGCAGFGISTALMILDQIPGFSEAYDVVLYDVLGDLVCGGFSVPMRKGGAREIYIVVSGDLASLYAANNVAKAVRNNARSGARLSGLIANRLVAESPLGVDAVTRFAKRINTRLVGVIPPDLQVITAAARGGTVTELYPDSESAAQIKRVFEAVRDTTEEDLTIPEPMENEELMNFLRGTGASEALV